ncbi:uncharacterized protein N7479_010380 [Penicillium vulpinum]|uniref:uncharacterized protein n=1 Tax=Penicillium vulpinum TaxID=29845 RepID=UPI002546BF21|nr:uncharacterized protein N7479_010380 [Penicillium vulpinum]KAJ5951967.1 hypothetical protein N7479_010380 [Penicillium vulpinum]
MARLSNISVVVPLPSFDIDPLKTFDDGFFDRAVDNILSEEASIESRDEMMDSSVGVSSPFGYDGTFDSPKLNVRRSPRIEAKSPHFPTPSTSSSPTSTTSKKPKSRRSSRIRKSVTVEDLNGDDKAPVNSGDITQPQPEKKALEVEPHPVPQGDSHAAALPQITDSSEMPTDDAETTAEEKIFASVSLEKQMEVLKFIASQSFMMEQVQPVRRATRRQFTGQVREFAMEAGMNNTAIDALIDHVRKIYLEDREITATEDASSAFGEEVDDEQEKHTKIPRRKRRKSSSDHSEGNENKKSKRHHSDKAKRHSHDSVQRDEPIKVTEAHVTAGAPIEDQDKACVEPDEPKQEVNMPDLPKMPTNLTRDKTSIIIDLTDSAPDDKLVPEATAVTPQNEGLQAIGIIPQSPPTERSEAESTKRRSDKTRNKEKNKRKRQRRKLRNKHRMTLGGQEQPQGDSTNVSKTQPQDTSIDGADQGRISPSIPRQTSFGSSNGSRRSSAHLPLPADPTLWDTDF